MHHFLFFFSISKILKGQIRLVWSYKHIQYLMYSDHATDSDTKSTGYIFTPVVPWSCRHHYSGLSSFCYKYESMMGKKNSSHAGFEPLLQTLAMVADCVSRGITRTVTMIKSKQTRWHTRVCTQTHTHTLTHNTQRKKTSKCWRWTQQRLPVLQTAFSCRSQNKNRMCQIISPMSEKDRKKYLKSPELLRSERL